VRPKARHSCVLHMIHMSDLKAH